MLRTFVIHIPQPTECVVSLLNELRSLHVSVDTNHEKILRGTHSILERRISMGIEHIKEQTLRHISSLTRYLDMSDEDRLKAWEWVYVVLWDYHRLHGPYEYISLGDVSYFFDIWYEDTYGDVADEDRCMCGLPLAANGRNCYSHMTRGY